MNFTTSAPPARPSEKLPNYGPLASLFNEIGKTVKPRIWCIANPQNQGAGLVDGGLLIHDQFQKAASEPLPDTNPAPGVMKSSSPASTPGLSPTASRSDFF